MHRRDVLNSAVVASAASLIGTDPVSSAEQATRTQRKPQPQPLKIIDTNVSLFQWPFRRLPLDNVVSLVRHYTSLGITQAWAGSFEAILHRDIRGVNHRLAEVCKEHSQLMPIGALNPTLPDWEEDLRLCAEQHKMSGIRLHPNYHGYPLHDPRAEQVIVQATKARLFVQIAACMEDTRTQHRLVHVPDVELEALVLLAKQHPTAQLQVLNYRPRGSLLAELGKHAGVFVDTARVDATDGVSTLIKGFPANRVLFGTHAPLLIPDAALIRVAEARLDTQQIESLMAANALDLLASVGGGR